MAENGNFSNSNGHSPFRRYVPPTNDSSNGTGNGQVMPFPQTPSHSSQRRPGSPVRPRRNRSARNRWRQWLNPPAPPPPTQGNRPSAAPGQTPQLRSPQPRPTTPADGSQPSPYPAANPSPTNPASFSRPGSGSPAPRTPSSPSFQSPSAPMTPSAYVKPPQSGQPLPSGVTPRGGQPPRMPSVPQPPSMSTAGTPSKVTPLRRKPPGAAPLPNSGQPRRDRKSGRRRHRPAPRPVLYGIRLLILGTGIAAIAGTLLSTLNPANNTAVSNSPTGGVTTPAAERSSRSTATTLSAPLPLAEELAYLETELVALEAMTPGLTQSVFVYDLDTGNYVDLNGGNAVAAASTIKVPILVAFLEAVDAGTVQLDQAVVLREDLIGSGSGDFQTQEIGSRYTALDVATAMSVNSDNTATNMMIELLGGREVLNQRFREWGLQATVLRNPLPDLDGTNTTSPADLVRIMALVDQGQILSLRSRDRLFNILQRTVNRRLIPDGLADDQAVVYNKTGDIGTALGDIALVDAANGKRYVLAALVTRPFNDGRASELIRRIAGRIHQEMSQPTSPVGGAPAAAEPASSESGTPLQEEMPDGTYRETTPMPTSPEGSFDAPGEVPQG